jgi:hypothetical protein
MVPAWDRIDVWWNLATAKAKTSRTDGTILLDGADDLIDAPPGGIRETGFVALCAHLLCWDGRLRIIWV